MFACLRALVLVRGVACSLFAPRNMGEEFILRLKQKSLVRGREVWAWSSPVWVKK